MRAVEMIGEVWTSFFTTVVVASLLIAAGAFAQGAPPVVQLARQRKALLPIVVPAEASQDIRELAEVLADYLGRIAGAEFKVITGDGRTGLALGTAEGFPLLDLKKEIGGDGFGADEQYVLRSHEKGLYAVGASGAAAQHAAWDLLFRLGYRQFFPGGTWEVVPEVEDLKIATDAHEIPDFAYRGIWYGYGTWDYNAQPLAEWRIRNRAPGTFGLNTGHSYGRIIRRYKDEFDAHPEYLALINDRRVSRKSGDCKFCVSNAGLQELVVRYAEDHFRANPDAACVSIDPSDGGGWCRCKPCGAMGSPSNRALTLANRISAVLEEQWPGKYVAMYAYNQHSPPPSIDARPRVIINVATAFIRGGFTVDEIIEGWRQQGVRQFGIREYYSVNTWDRDLPNAARGAKLDYLARTVPHFHAAGARFLSSEASDNWGPNGLGYYVATRMLWDVDEAANVETLVDDFLEKAFRAAREPMARFYRLLNGPDPPLMSHDLLGRMYRLLGEAASISDDAKIRSRIDHLILYTRYVELFRVYSNAAGDERQAAFERLIRHAYRMRKTMMVHTKGLYRDLHTRDKSVTIPEEAQWHVAEEKNPWKSSRPWARAELDEILQRGIAANRPIEFEPIDFSHRLVPADPLWVADVPALDDSQRGRGEQVIHTWFGKSPAALDLKVTGGLIAHYRDRGNVQLQLFSLNGAEEQLVDQNHDVPPDGKQYEITLRSDRTGLHKLVVRDGSDMTEVLWPEGVPRTIQVSRERSSEHSGRRSGYFYVPRGTRFVGGYASRAGGACIKDADGNEVFRLKELDGADHFQIAVPQGRDGRLWSFHRVPGRFILMTVPPCSARRPDELLLPKEVVEADADAA